MSGFAGWALALALSIATPGARADETVEAIGDAFIANLPSDWNVTVGSWVYMDTLKCFTTPGYSCYCNNPLSPYGSPYFGEYGPEPNLATLQLGNDEAVVVIFRTPPAMRYFSFNQYLYQKPGSSSAVFASMSDALSHRELGTTGSTEPGTSPFDSYAALVWTADQNSFDSVQALLMQSGLPLHAINYLPLPQAIPAVPPQAGYALHLGHGPGYEAFNLLMRTALPHNQADFDAYLKENPYYVLRVGPGIHLPPAPSPVIGYPSEVSGIVEDPALQTALKRLVANIQVHYGASFTMKRQQNSYTTHTGWDCITGLTDCAGDNYDALYSREMSRLARVRDLQDFVIVVGVNHQKTGKAAYASFTVYDPDKLASIVSVADSDLTTRSALYHAGITDPDDPRTRLYRGLFAYMFAYDCGGKQYCAEIPAPTESNPVGLEPGAPFFVLGRSYMEPNTLVRPSVEEIVGHQVFIGSRQ